jgi:hypothetical protein
MAFQASGGGILRRADPLLVSSTNLAGPPSSSHLLRQWLHPFFASLSLTPHLFMSNSDTQLRLDLFTRLTSFLQPRTGGKETTLRAATRDPSQATQYSRAPSRSHTPISDKQ